MTTTHTEPFYGATHTVQAITAQVVASQNRYEVRQLVEDVCRDIRSKDALSEALALYHFVDAETRYMRDPATVELVKAPYTVCADIIAGRRPCIDCDDMAALLAAMLMAAGHKCRLVTVAFKNTVAHGERQYSHVFTQYYDARSGVWLTLDPVARERTSTMHARVTFARVYPLG